MTKRIFSIGLLILVGLNGLATFIGVALTLAMKEKPVADAILSHYGPYIRAEIGYNKLKDMVNPLQNGPDPTNIIRVGVLTIDDVGWNEFLNFLKSEVAIRKSDRNEPGTFGAPTINNNDPLRQSATVQPINFDRIKTIISTRQDFATAGTKPLVPPFRLIVIWPTEQFVIRRLYEFISFEEFRLDLRAMFVGEIETWSSLLAFISIALGAIVVTVRFVAERVNLRWQGSPKRDVATVPANR